MNKKIRKPMEYYNNIREIVGTTIKNIEEIRSDETLILTECGKKFCICCTDSGYDGTGSYIYTRDTDENIDLDHMVFFELLTEDELSAIEEQEKAEWEISNDKRKRDDLIRLADSLGYDIIKKDKGEQIK